MQTYNIHDAKTHLSKLVEQAASGESHRQGGQADGQGYGAGYTGSGAKKGALVF